MLHYISSKSLYLTIGTKKGIKNDMTTKNMNSKKARFKVLLHNRRFLKNKLNLKSLFLSFVLCLPFSVFAESDKINEFHTQQEQLSCLFDTIEQDNINLKDNQLEACSLLHFYTLIKNQEDQQDDIFSQEELLNQAETILDPICPIPFPFIEDQIYSKTQEYFPTNEAQDTFPTQDNLIKILDPICPIPFPFSKNPLYNETQTHFSTQNNFNKYPPAYNEVQQYLFSTGDLNHDQVYNEAQNLFSIQDDLAQH